VVWQYQLDRGISALRAMQGFDFNRAWNRKISIKWLWSQVS